MLYIYIYYIMREYIKKTTMQQNYDIKKKNLKMRT